MWSTGALVGGWGCLPHCPGGCQPQALEVTDLDERRVAAIPPLQPVHCSALQQYLGLGRHMPAVAALALASGLLPPIHQVPCRNLSTGFHDMQARAPPMPGSGQLMLGSCQRNARPGARRCRKMQADASRCKRMQACASACKTNLVTPTWEAARSRHRDHFHQSLHLSVGCAHIPPAWLLGFAWFAWFAWPVHPAPTTPSS